MKEEITYIKTQLAWWRTWGWIRPFDRKVYIASLEARLAQLELMDLVLRTGPKRLKVAV